MITLPNGDKWILDEREFKIAHDAGISWEDIYSGKMPETPIEDFVRELLKTHQGEGIDGSRTYYIMPRKQILDARWEHGCHWDCNGDPHNEILGVIAVRSVKNFAFCAYEMPSGEVHVVYRIPGEGGYLATTEVVSFSNREEYAKAVNF